MSYEFIRKLRSDLDALMSAIWTRAGEIILRRNTILMGYATAWDDLRISGAMTRV